MRIVATAPPRNVTSPSYKDNRAAELSDTQRSVAVGIPKASPPCSHPPKVLHPSSSQDKPALSLIDARTPLPPTPPPPSVAIPQEVNRPGSLGPVPKGSRQDSCPFEIEVNKTALGLGLTLGMDETGMILVKSLTPRSPITKDGNIRCVMCACVCVCVCVLCACVLHMHVCAHV